MTLRLCDIKPGAVAYLDGIALGMDRRVWHPIMGTIPGIPHPFVCIAAENGNSIWLSLTSSQSAVQRFQRLHVPTDWRFGGSSGWVSRPQFVHDARAPFCGPDDAFVKASEDEVIFGMSRPGVTETGLTFLIAEVEQYRPLSKHFADLEAWLHRDREAMTDSSP